MIITGWWSLYRISWMVFVICNLFTFKIAIYHWLYTHCCQQIQYRGWWSYKWTIVWHATIFTDSSPITWCNWQGPFQLFSQSHLSLFILSSSLSSKCQGDEGDAFPPPCFEALDAAGHRYYLFCSLKGPWWRHIPGVPLPIWHHSRKFLDSSKQFGHE